jgi:hypothetical protein
MKKNEMIKEIKSIIDTYGSFSSGEIELDSSPIYHYNNKDNFSLIEEFYSTHVGIVSYIHDTAVDEFNVLYEDLMPTQLTEVFEIVREYEKYTVDFDED